MILPSMSKQQPITITTMTIENREVAIATEDREVAMEGIEVAAVEEDAVVAAAVQEEHIPEIPLVIRPMLMRALS
jgi:hypothetical protein